MGLALPYVEDSFGPFGNATGRTYLIGNLTGARVLVFREPGDESGTPVWTLNIVARREALALTGISFGVRTCVCEASCWLLAGFNELQM